MHQILIFFILCFGASPRMSIFAKMKDGSFTRLTVDRNDFDIKGQILAGQRMVCI